MLKVLLGMMLCLSAVCRADAYDDRLHLHYQNETAKELAQLRSEYSQGEAAFLSRVLAFANAHGGFASAPDCRGLFVDNDSGGNVRQACVRNFCVNVRVIAHNWGSDSISQKLMYFDTTARSCRINLNDGLACEYNIGNGPRCLDANGNVVGGSSVRRHRRH